MDDSDLSKREPYVVQPIGLDDESQKRRDWRVIVNGQEFTEPVASVKLVNDKMGRDVIYGWRPEGFDGVMLHEPGGGGAVTIPWLRGVDADGRPQIFIGLTDEYRGPAGGTILNAPRGFIDPGSDHLNTAKQEIREETGHSGTDRIQQLGAPLNSNSDAYNTSGTADDGQPEGVRIYGFEVFAEEVDRLVSEGGEVTYRFIQSIRSQTGSKSHERIFGTVFVPVATAGQTPDAFTRAAVGDLMAYLVGQGVMQLRGHNGGQ